MTTPPALHGWRVLVPRTPEQAAATITALARHGAHGHAVPTICITPPQDPTPLHNALVGLPTGRFAWTIFTSINAVTATRKTLEQLHPNQPSNTHFTHTRVACVGGVTHAALNTWGINTILTPPHRFSAAGLLDIW
ncbi:uroporphyrinogen-III synthase, partial [Dermatophilus congolensis]|nr:uroporphyrinogen-III synthase [Dermatophilus congolensis]